MYNLQKETKVDSFYRKSGVMLVYLGEEDFLINVDNDLVRIKIKDLVGYKFEDSVGYVDVHVNAAFVKKWIGEENDIKGN